MCNIGVWILNCVARFVPCALVWTALWYTSMITGNTRMHTSLQRIMNGVMLSLIVKLYNLYMLQYNQSVNINTCATARIYWLKHCKCLNVEINCVVLYISRIAQLVEYRTVGPKVVGSNRSSSSRQRTLWQNDTSSRCQLLAKNTLVVVMTPMPGTILGYSATRSYVTRARVCICLPLSVCPSVRSPIQLSIVGIYLNDMTSFYSVLVRSR